MNFRGAVFCSAAIHIGFLALRPPSAFVPPRQTLYPLEVSYIVMEPAKKAAPLAGMKQPQARRDAAPTVPAPKPAVPEQAAPPKRQETPKPPENRPAPAPPPAEPVRRLADPAAPGRGPSSPPPSAVGAAAVPEGEFALIRHKERVRAFLRQQLRFPESRMEGTVRLRVTLLPDGSLKSAAALEASDPALAVIALRDARAAGPYPHFPREMRSEQAEYEFLVQYRPDRDSL